MPHIKKQMISFFLTTSCNLRCIYCYNKEERYNREEINLSLEFAKKGIDDFFSRNSSRHIRFYGPGEPTQKLCLMKEIKEYAHSIAEDELTTEIQTNGAFSAEVCKWILDNINIIWISFDGPPDIQNYYRPFPENRESSKVIENNVKFLIKNKELTGTIGARVTITDKNIFRQKEMVDYFRQLGIRYIWTDPIFPAVENIPVCLDEKRNKKSLINMDIYVENYLEAFEYAKDRGIFYGSILMCNFDGTSDYHCRACTPVPHLTPDGFVSACDMCCFGENAYHMDAFIIGKWNEDTKQINYFPDKIKALQNRKVCNLPHCQECEISEHCGGYCLGEVMNETGSLYGQKESYCKAIKKLSEVIGFFSESYDFLHP